LLPFPLVLWVILCLLLTLEPCADMLLQFEIRFGPFGNNSDILSPRVPVLGAQNPLYLVLWVSSCLYFSQVGYIDMLKGNKAHPDPIGVTFDPPPSGCLSEKSRLRPIGWDDGFALLATELGVRFHRECVVFMLPRFALLLPEMWACCHTYVPFVQGPFTLRLIYITDACQGMLWVYPGTRHVARAIGRVPKCSHGSGLQI
jgi:hypothetical protein